MSTIDVDKFLVSMNLLNSQANKIVPEGKADSLAAAPPFSA